MNSKERDELKFPLNQAFILMKKSNNQVELNSKMTNYREDQQLLHKKRSSKHRFIIIFRKERTSKI